MSYLVKRRNQGRKYGYSQKYGKKILLDEFGSAYFAHEQDDSTIPVPISLPKSLLMALDKRIGVMKKEPNINRRREGMTRSRFIRHLIEKELNLEFDVF